MQYLQDIVDVRDTLDSVSRDRLAIPEFEAISRAMYASHFGHDDILRSALELCSAKFSGFMILAHAMNSRGARCAQIVIDWMVDHGCMVSESPLAFRVYFRERLLRAIAYWTIEDIMSVAHLLEIQDMDFLTDISIARTFRELRVFPNSRDFCGGSALAEMVCVNGSDSELVALFCIIMNRDVASRYRVLREICVRGCVWHINDAMRETFSESAWIDLLRACIRYADRCFPMVRINVKQFAQNLIKIRKKIKIGLRSDNSAELFVLVARYARLPERAVNNMLFCCEIAGPNVEMQIDVISMIRRAKLQRNFTVSRENATQNLREIAFAFQSGSMIVSRDFNMIRTIRFLAQNIV
jgi:hypothetical protein